MRKDKFWRLLLRKEFGRSVAKELPRVVIMAGGTGSRLYL